MRILESFVLISSITLCSSAFADTAPKEGGGAADLLNNTKNLPGSAPGTGVIQFTTSCTETNGTVLHQNDAAYEQCLRNAQSKAGKPGTAPNAGAGASTSFKFGS